jgi:hypothetical protein
MLLIIFLVLRVVAGRSQTRAGLSHAVSARPVLIHNAKPCPCPAHASLCRGLEMSLLERHGRGMERSRLGRGRAFVNQTRSHCVNQMEKTQSKPLAARHGREMGTEWYM